MRGFELPPQVEAFLESDEYIRTKANKEHMRDYLNSIEEFSNEWEIYSQSANWKIYYKPETLEDGADSFAFGGETVIKSNFLNPTTILAEHELFMDWVPQLKGCTIKHENNLWTKLVHVGVNVPFPFSDRDVLLEVQGCMLPESNSMCLMMQSVHSPNWYGYATEAADPDIVRMDVHSCFAYMKAIDEETTLFKVIVNVDLKFDLIPIWLIKFGMSKGVAVWLERICKYSENFKDTKWEKQQIKNPLYRLIKKRLDTEYNL